MSQTTRVAGLSTIVFALLGLAWFALELVPPSLGFDDTDSPAVSIEFIRAYPQIFVLAGLVLIGMAISFVTSILSIAEVLGNHASSLAARSLSVLALFAAAFFMVAGGIKIGASGPLLHMAGLRPEWGEAAYVVAQVVGQALLISAVVGLSIWAIGLSVIGFRRKFLPGWLVALAILPAFRLFGGVLGPIGALPDIGLLWILSILAIPGTMVWCLLLGLALLRRSFRPATVS